MVLGASLKEERYSNKAIKLLREYGHEVIAIGLRSGPIGDVTITTEKAAYSDVDTITLYLNPSNQIAYEAYIFEIAPKRVIFNPGTENPDFQARLAAKGIKCEVACTLVLLRTNQFEVYA